MMDNRKFSFVFAAFICMLGWLFSFLPVAFWIAGITIALGLIYPKSLELPKAAFMKLSHWMGTINSIIILSIIYFLLFTLFGFISKLSGRRLIADKKDLSLESYWQKKPDVDYKRQMKYQF